MKSGFKLFSSLFLALVFLISCSEDSTNEPTNSDNFAKYVPLTVGSYWIYETWNSNENWDMESLLTRDSVVVLKETSYDGKTAAMLVTYDTETGEATDTTYQNYSNSKMYLFETTNPLISEASWIEMIDFNSNGKTLVDTTLTDVNTGQGSFSGNVIYSYLKGANKSISLKSTNYNALTFDYTATVEGTLNMGVSIDFDMGVNTGMYLVENIGRVQTLSKVVTSAMGDTQIEYTKEILVDWKIK